MKAQREIEEKIYPPEQTCHNEESGLLDFRKVNHTAASFGDLATERYHSIQRNSITH